MRVLRTTWASLLTVWVAAVMCSPAALGSNPPSTADLMRSVEELIEFGAYGEALEALTRVAGCVRRDSPQCLVALARVRNLNRQFEPAIEDARAAIELVPTRDLAARAWLELGRAQLGLAGPQQLREALRDAARSCRRALREDEATVPEARFYLGLALLRLGRTRRGSGHLEHYLADEPGGVLAARSRRLIERPSCAVENCLSPFSVVTTAGRRLDSRELSGKVVLIEFWATWCPPCLDALPRLDELIRRMAGMPFVALGINVDGDRATLSRYVEQHGLGWPQVWDEGQRISRETFGVRSYPTLVLADHRGVVRYSAVGWSAEIEAALSRELRSAVNDAVVAAGQAWQPGQ
jgi:thiol-disulfide isomerase/thioredoxin